MSNKLPLLNPHHIVSIPQGSIDLLYRLYPQLSITSSPLTHSFICQKDIRSLQASESLKYSCSNFIVVSNVIFDEALSLEDLQELTSEFRSNFLHKRFSKIQIPSYAEPLDYLTQALYGLEETNDESPIYELFEQVGTKQFQYSFLNLSQSIPVQILLKSFLTFLSKTRLGVSSLYYKKQNLRLGSKLNQNLNNSIKMFNRDYRIGITDTELQLLTIRFHNHLFRIK